MQGQTGRYIKKTCKDGKINRKIELEWGCATIHTADI
jgi:hypothetical protein